VCGRQLLLRPVATTSSGFAIGGGGLLGLLLLRWLFLLLLLACLRTTGLLGLGLTSAIGAVLLSLLRRGSIFAGIIAVGLVRGSLLSLPLVASLGSLESSLDSSFVASAFDSPSCLESSFLSSVEGASFISSSFFSSESAGLSSFSVSAGLSSSFFESPLEEPFAPSAFSSTLSSLARFTTSLPDRSTCTAGLSGDAFFLMVLPFFDSMAISPCSLTSATVPPGLPLPQFQETIRQRVSKCYCELSE
jgi:hypothetical protein